MPARMGPVHEATRSGLRVRAETRRSGYTDEEIRLGGATFPHQRKLTYKRLDNLRKRRAVAAYIRKAKNR